MRFTVLGPVGASRAGRPLPALPPRHRAVLAYLLLHARTVISADRLIGAMWGTAPPDTARAQIQASIAAIRRMLREAGSDGMLRTRTAGYVLLAEPEQLDLEEFDRRLRGATLADEIREALGLWQGQALADVHADFVDEVRARLEDRRLNAVERLAELGLEQGLHEKIIDELAALVAAHPLRERVTSHLMLALHRAGRQADALAAARAFRAALVEQQGLDPSRAFLALEQSILRDDPALDGQRLSFLPYDLPDFTGRAAEFDRLVQPASIAVIDGMAGIGKTALAVHVAHRMADRFPDGQLFVDLHAHTPGQAPIEPGAALETLLLQLGIAPERLPAATAARSALWRAELVHRRVLIVLDNAGDTGQVRPLLPGASHSLVLITSRRRLIDLDGASTLSLGVLPADDAVALFASIVGERAQARPAAVLKVLRLCGFLPLAVRISAARLRHRAAWSVEHLAERLREQGLPELETAERGVAVAFSLSYQQLDGDHQRLFRLLGLHPGADFAPHAAAALADLPLRRAAAILEDLLDANLLIQHVPGRFTFHDLLREYAHAVAVAEDCPQEALTRLFDHYLYAASQAVDVVFPDGRERRPRIPAPGMAEVSFDDQSQALAWLDAERANLVAVGAQGWSTHTGRLAVTLHRYLFNHAHHLDALAVHTEALNVSRRIEDRPGEARALLDLAAVHARQGRAEQALECAERALTLHRELGDLFSEARTLHHLGELSIAKGDYQRADDAYRRAAQLWLRLDEPINLAVALCGQGTNHREQERYGEALELFGQALQGFGEHGHGLGEAFTLNHLGIVHRRQGRYEQALDHHRRALDLYRDLGYRVGELEVLNDLGESFMSAAEPEQAVREHADALALAVGIHDRPGQARAHSGLARAHRDLGRADLARSHATAALELFTESDEMRALLAAL